LDYSKNDALTPTNARTDEEKENKVRTMSLPVRPVALTKGEKTQEVTLQGYLFKQGEIHKSWKKRWFYLDTDNNFLVYYKTKPDASLSVKELGRIYISAIKKVIFEPNDFDSQTIPASLPSGHPCLFQISTQKRVYNFASESDEIRSRWTSFINLLMRKVTTTHSLRN